MNEEEQLTKQTIIQYGDNCGFRVTYYVESGRVRFEGDSVTFFEPNGFKNFLAFFLKIQTDIENIRRLH